MRIGDNAFPADARLNRVLGVLRLLHANSGKIGISKFASLSHSNVDHLLHEINVAKALGMIKVSKNGVVQITRLGEQVYHHEQPGIEGAAKRLRSIEPFRTAFEISKTSNGFAVDDLARILASKRIVWHTEKQKNVSTVKLMLMQWAIYFRILAYDGRDGLWFRG